jgi:hypothetical protein
MLIERDAVAEFVAAAWEFAEGRRLAGTLR